MSRLHALLVLILLALVLFSLGIGAVPLSLGEVTVALLQPATGGVELSDPVVQQRIIVNEIRLPRVLLAILVGASLGAAGAARSEEHTSELQSRENLVCRLI